MDTATVIGWRREIGFLTPLEPVEAGKPVLMFDSRGSYEWLMHPDDALYHCAFGIEVHGVRLDCRVVDCAPFMGAFMVQARDGSVNTRFIP